MCAPTEATTNRAPSRFTSRGGPSSLGRTSLGQLAQVNGKEIVSTRNGSKVRRYATQGHEVWEYDLKEIPLPTPLNAGVDDLLSPFAFVDRRSLRYEGAEVVGDRVRHVFLGTLRGMESEGLLDTRKGFRKTWNPTAFGGGDVLMALP